MPQGAIALVSHYSVIVIFTCFQEEDEEISSFTLSPDNQVYNKPLSMILLCLVIMSLRTPDCGVIISDFFIIHKKIYSRTSIAGTLMTHLSRLFLESLEKNHIAADFG